MWCDSHRPQDLSELSYHDELSETFKRLSVAGEFPHLLVYGSTGSGKKTRIMCLLKELFGPGVNKVRNSTKPYKVSKSKTIELTILSSNHHVEMNPSDAGIYDRVIVQEVIKSMASAHNMPRGKDKKRFKVVLLEEVDQLTKSAQHALRRTMEKYMEYCRLILCCESVSKVIDPLRSRCLAIRVPAPSKIEVERCLHEVAKKENFVLPEKVAKKIVNYSRRNLRRAINSLQICYIDTQGEIKESTVPKSYPWEMFIDNICDELLREQRPVTLNQARLKIYELLQNCIPGHLVLKRMSQRLMENVDDSLKHKIAYWAAHHEARMNCCNKQMPHIIAFTAKFMYIYKQWMDSWLDF